MPVRKTLLVRGNREPVSFFIYAHDIDNDVRVIRLAQLFRVDTNTILCARRMRHCGHAPQTAAQVTPPNIRI